MSEALVKKGTEALAELPEYMRGDESLQLDIAPGDLKPPRLSICQSMTPQRKRTEPTYIDGLQEGDLFNVTTGQNYGNSALRFVILNHFTSNLYFDNGGVKCRSNGGLGCELNNGGPCKHSQWIKGEKPLCTKFVNFVVYLPDHDDIVVLPFKSTGMKAAEALLQLSRAGAGQPVFIKLMSLQPAPSKGAKGDYFVPVVKRIGNFLPEEELYGKLKKLFVELRSGARKVEVDEAAIAAEVVEEGDQVSGDDKIPF